MTKRRINKEIKTELSAIAARSKDGRLHWEHVVERARNKASVLHGYFDWNRERAMEAYLRQQAEALIAGYYVSVSHPTTGEKIRTRAFVSLSTDRQSGGGYRAIVDVLSDAQLKARLLADALADMATFRQRYKQLAELAGLFREIERVQKRQRRAA